MNIGKLMSILSGLAIGGWAGIHIAQTYEVPNMGMLIENVQEKVGEYVKEEDKSKNNKD